MHPNTSSIPCLSVRGVSYCKSNLTQIYYGGKVIATDDCNLNICSLVLSHWGYLPNKPSNFFFVALFFLFLVLNIPLGVWKRTWPILAAMFLGCLCEGVGTVGRIMAANKPFEFLPFLIYIIFLTIGPAFLSAVIYLCLSRIVVVYGEENSRFKPQTYSIVFMVSDFVCLILQGGGGGLAASAKDDKDKAQKGINVMLAGLAWQVASLTLFFLAAGDFAWRVRKGKSPSKYQALTSRRRWKGFLWALGIAAVTIYIRSVYRVAELSQGFTGVIADKEIPYIIFEPLMIVAACVCLTVWHPAYVFGDLWQATDYRVNKQDAETNLEKGGDFEKDLPSRPTSTASMSTTSSENTLSIEVYPDRERKASNWSTNSRWYIAHHSDCPHHGTERRPSQQAISTRSGSRVSNSPPEPDVRTPLLRPDIQFSNVNYLSSQQEARRFTSQPGPIQITHPHQDARFLGSHSDPRHSIHSPKTAPLARPLDQIHTPTWTSSHQPFNPRTATLPRTPRGQHHDDHMHWG